MSNSTELTVAQQREQQIRALLNKAAPKMLDVLPRTSNLQPEKIIRLALMDVSQNNTLRSCEPMTILTSVIHAAALGLQIGPFLGEAYLVPRKGKCTLIPGYKGLAKLAMQGLSISGINARLVYKDDEFDVQYGTQPRIVHRPKLDGSRKDEDIVAAYMVADLRGGGQHFEVMTRDEVEKRRKSSAAGDDGPWVQWYPEQVKKTVVRYGVKLLPASADADAFERLNAAIELDNRFDTGRITAPSPLLDTDDVIREEMSNRTQEQAKSLGERLSVAKAAAKRGSGEVLSDEENLALDRAIAAQDEAQGDA